MLALAALAGFATYVVNGLFNSYLVEEKVTIPFWSAIGIIAALGRRIERPERTGEKGYSADTSVPLSGNL